MAMCLCIVGGCGTPAGRQQQVALPVDPLVASAREARSRGLTDVSRDRVIEEFVRIDDARRLVAAIVVGRAVTPVASTFEDMILTWYEVSVERVLINDHVSDLPV